MQAVIFIISINTCLPAAARYERELHDMFEGLYRMIIGSAAVVCMKLILKIFIRCANVLIFDADIAWKRETTNGCFAREMGYSRSTLCSPIHAGIIEPEAFRFSQRPVNYSAVRCQVIFTHQGIRKSGRR